MFRPGSSSRALAGEQEAQIQSVIGPTAASFLSEAGTSSRPPTEAASRQPPTAFRHLPAAPLKDEGELFVFRKPGDEENSFLSAASAASPAATSLLLQGQITAEAEGLIDRGAQSQQRGRKLDDLFVFKPNNRTPLSRLVQNFEDFADETVGRITVLGQPDSFHQATSIDDDILILLYSNNVVR